MSSPSLEMQGVKGLSTAVDQHFKLLMPQVFT
uniref:Uncharacterized protein n=1 Tax=Anguilla anguilla TaxID=7936 RepID=A0A0E9VU34_ANGAN